MDAVHNAYTNSVARRFNSPALCDSIQSAWSLLERVRKITISKSIRRMVLDCRIMPYCFDHRGMTLISVSVLVVLNLLTS